MENSMSSERHSLPPRSLGRKRRSSILKPQRPFADVQNLSRDREDSRLSKDRRVSFCPTIEVKEFHKHNPTDPSSGGPGQATQSTSKEEDVKQVSLSATAEEIPQMSTPVRRKKRRISATAQLGRLSIIPKLDKSISFLPDDDFVIFEDEEQRRSQMPPLPPATAPPNEITLLEELPDPQTDDVMDLQLGGDLMLDLDCIETVTPEAQAVQCFPEMANFPPGPAEPEASTTPPPPLPPSATPPPVLPPAMTEEDSQRLMELFPQAAIPLPATAPTIATTPLSGSPGRSYILGLPTPEKGATPPPLRRRRILATFDYDSSDSVPMEEGTVEGGEATMELTGDCGEERTGGVASTGGCGGDVTGASGSKTDLNKTSTIATPGGMTDTEPQSMSLTLLTAANTTSHHTSTTSHTLVAAETHSPPPLASAASPPLNDDEEEVEVPWSDTVHSPVSVTLTSCLEVEVTSWVPGGGQEVVGAASGLASMDMDMTCQSEAMVSHDSITTTHQDNTSPASVIQDNTSPASVIQDNTLSASVIQDNTSSASVIQDNTSPASVIQDNTFPASVIQDSTLPTAVIQDNTLPASVIQDSTLDSTLPTAVIQDSTLPTTDHGDVPPVALPPPPHTNSVFKQPKRPLRTQLRLKSSQGKKIVRASPIVRMSCLATPSSLLLSTTTITTPIHPLSLSRSSHLHNTTFTISSAPVTSTASSALDIHPSPLPPSTPSQISPPHTHTSPPPLSPMMSQEGAAVECLSILASPPLSPPPPPVMITLPQASSKWLQSPGDSFNLVNSGDYSMKCSPPTVGREAATESVERSSEEWQEPQGAASISEQQEEEGVLLGQEQPPFYAQVSATVGATPITPAYPISSQTSRLATALQQLQVGSKPSSSLPAPPPLTIDTPETALVVVDYPVPSPVNHTLHLSSLQVALNDTTMCEGGGRRSVLLSPSIYDKFVGQICSGEGGEAPGNGCQDDTIVQSQSDAREDTLLTYTHKEELLEHAPPPSTSLTPSPDSTLFSHFISDLTSRLYIMLYGVQQRLGSEAYTSSDNCLPLVLGRWSRVLAACLGTLTVFQQYGEVSALSNTFSWSRGLLPSELAVPFSGDSDMEGGGLAMKADWIIELNGCYNALLPAAELARDQAALLYGWYFEEWTHDTNTQYVTVSVKSKRHKFRVSVSDILKDRLTATSAIVQTIWNHMT